MTRTDGEAVRGATQEDLAARVREVVERELGPDAAAEVSVATFRGQAAVRLPALPDSSLWAALRDDAELAFEMLTDVTCVHFPRRPEPLGEYDVVYHLTSLSKGHRLRLKVACPDPDAGVPSATPVWMGADFMEREAFDMFGVRFQGHPNLKRILLSDEYDGWPLRKDFPYRGH